MFQVFREFQASVTEMILVSLIAFALEYRVLVITLLSSHLDP